MVAAEEAVTTATPTPTPIANEATDSKSIVKKMETAPTKEIEKPPQQSPNKQLVLIKNMVLTVKQENVRLHNQAQLDQSTIQELLQTNKELQDQVARLQNEKEAIQEELMAAQASLAFQEGFDL